MKHFVSQYLYSKAEKKAPGALSEPSTANFTKKVRVSADYIHNPRRMKLAFETKLESEVNWAINCLLLLSCNTTHNYQLEANGLLEAIVSYLDYLAERAPRLPAKRARNETLFALREQLLSMLVVLRNFALVRQNEIILYKTEGLVKTCVKVLDRSYDKEVIDAVLEVLMALGRHIFLKDLDCQSELVSGLISCLQTNLAEKAIEVFRKLTLPISNEEVLENLPQVFFDELAKWLLSHTKSKDSVLEILCNLSDQAYATRARIANAPGCIKALVKLLSCSSASDETEDKPAKMAALVLSNLSLAPRNMPLFEPFQVQIFFVAASDERLGGLLSPILYQINQLDK